MHLAFARRASSMLFLASALTALAACGGGGGAEVKTSSANASSLARYKTYAHEPPAAPPNGGATTPAVRTAEVLDKARAKVDAELQRRGYTAAPADKAELLVRVTATVRQVADHATGQAAAADAPTGADDISVIAVDLIDEKTKETVFHGSARKEVHTKKVKDEEISAAVAELFEPVPDSAGGAP